MKIGKCIGFFQLYLENIINKNKDKIFSIRTKIEPKIPKIKNHFTYIKLVNRFTFLTSVIPNK
jgi:hypothetical protein